MPRLRLLARRHTKEVEEKIKQEELETIKTRLETVQKKKAADTPIPNSQLQKAIEENSVDGDSHHFGASGRFLLDKAASDLILLKGKTSHFRAWLDAREVNKLLKRAQSSSNTKEMLVELLARCYGMVMVQEETKSNLQNDVSNCEQKVEHLGRKCTLMQETQ